MKPAKATYTDIVSALLVTLFTYAALSKLFEYSNFKFQLGRSPYLTDISGFVAWSLPVAELLTSFLLVSMRTRLWGLYCSLMLMLLFTGYIFIMLRYSHYLPCSCGGVLSMMSWHQHLYFNIIFTLLTLSSILMLQTKNPSQALAKHL